MKRKRILIFFLVAVMLMAVLPQAAAQTTESEEAVRTNLPVITGYHSNITSIHKGNRVTITVSVKDTDFKTEDGALLDVTKLVDSFSGGTVSLTVTSKAGSR